MHCRQADCWQTENLQFRMKPGDNDPALVANKAEPPRIARATFYCGRVWALCGHTGLFQPTLRSCPRARQSNP